MRRYIFTQWKEHAGTVALIILGFFVANFIMSVGITMSKQTIEGYQDNLIGNPEDQVTIYLDLDKTENFWDDCRLLKGIGEIQLLSQGNVSVQKDKAGFACQPVPVWFEREEDWHYNILWSDFSNSGKILKRRCQRKPSISVKCLEIQKLSRCLRRILTSTTVQEIIMKKN